MTEPASTAAGGVALYKLGIAFGLFAVIAAVVVMCMTLPRSVREFGVALMCTLVGSLAGGAFVITWFGIGHWASDVVGLVALGGVIFVCGLPAWVMVRGWFAYTEASKGRSLLELIRELRAAAKGEA
mgnify:CR=1 FL=1